MRTSGKQQWKRYFSSRKKFRDRMSELLKLISFRSEKGWVFMFHLPSKIWITRSELCNNPKKTDVINAIPASHKISISSGFQVMNASHQHIRFCVNPKSNFLLNDCPLWAALYLNNSTMLFLPLITRFICRPTVGK